MQSSQCFTVAVSILQLPAPLYFYINSASIKETALQRLVLAPQCVYLALKVVPFLLFHGGLLPVVAGELGVASGRGPALSAEVASEVELGAGFAVRWVAAGCWPRLGGFEGVDFGF